MLLVLADAEAAPLPGQPPAKVRQAAETALQILDRAARLGLAHSLAPRVRGKFLEEEAITAVRSKSLSERPRSSRPAAVDFFLLGEQQDKSLTALGKRSVRSSAVL